MTDLVSHARAMLDESSRGTVSSWPRAAALLARQQLEAALDGFWAARVPELRWAAMRPQLACLRVYAGPALAADVTWAWHALSRATHHHPYELEPTREELAWLIDETERVVGLLNARRADG